MDGRTWEAQLVRSTVCDLTAHVGGNPSAAQRALIDRAAWMTLHIAQLDRRTAESRMMTEHDSRHYLAWTNSLSKTLRHLGLQGRAERPPSLAEYPAAQAGK